MTKKKDQLGRNMTLIWKNVMGKVVNWVSGNGGGGRIGVGNNLATLTNQKKIKSTKTKQKIQEKLNRYQKLSKLINSNKMSKSAFGNVRTVHRVGISDVNGNCF